ncbi:circadian clock protein KaiC [Duganella sp. BJB488]|uniref:ATPase domain-containing protein n=1 Tax=unclassified Duganella TaxID=2636909 RepID=UPI000E345642|nr:MULTISPECIES: ATPase domain-containing protein [unclassified Duganella]RFP11782.1 circadian clock protein KaiC [Duganella sp. BJB489]RFP15723.1 circadian clock protein KaiC [Duganella sp. BJB488]RFP30670.1 circadian clock protein KaiC [Duganella sp. BJB480]
MQAQNSVTTLFLSSGVPGLDEILAGGLTRDRLYLVEGEPGTGKTTLALQFLNEGARHGESVLYITLAETAVELRSVAESHGWTMEGIHIEEILPNEDVLDPEQQYTIFHPSEIELGTTTQRIVAAIDKYRPRRVVLDSLSELQLLAESPLRYRRQVLALKQYLTSRSCTTIFLDDRTALSTDLQVRSVAHAVLTLEQVDQAYGAERRRLRVVKYRGIAFHGGAHDYKIASGGLKVFPRLVAAATRAGGARRQLSSGLPELDQLIGGGLEEGMSTLISGPPGTGKSTLAAQFVHAASERGEPCAMFLFEEARNNMLNRSTGLGMKLAQAMERGLLTIQQIDPAELAPGQFTYAVTQAVERGARMVVIDSLNGYLNAVPDERFLSIYLHELLTYLGQRGVVSIVVGVQQGMIGSGMSTTIDASYIADNVIMLRYFEAQGEVRQAISVFKKRGSAHERTIRGFQIGREGIRVGPVLQDFHGILTGVPTYDGPKSRKAD